MPPKIEIKDYNSFKNNNKKEDTHHVKKRKYVTVFIFLFD